LVNFACVQLVGILSFEEGVKQTKDKISGGLQAAIQRASEMLDDLPLKIYLPRK